MVSLAASTPFSSASAPFSGLLLPDAVPVPSFLVGFGALLVQPPAALSGTWRLAVADVVGNNNGSLTSWAIQFRFASANIFSSVMSFAIPDYSTAGVSSAISVTLCSRPPSVQLRRISVIFNITHTCDQDLVINLASPDNISLSD